MSNCYLTRNKQTHVTVIVDAFRAFATAAYVLEHKPATYMLTTKSAVISRLALNLSKPLIIGKPEKGADLIYDIPNSPTRVQEVKIFNRNVFHRTEAGAKGVLFAKNTDIILAAGFVNADATVRYIKTLSSPKVTIIAMGHEAITPVLEDDICARYIKNLIYGKKTNLDAFIPGLRQGSGKYFFAEDQWQYPKSDFDLCLKRDQFNFAIEAIAQNDYAILTRCDIDYSKEIFAVQSVVIRQASREFRDRSSEAY